MLTLTITLVDTIHQIVLGFQKQQAADEAIAHCRADTADEITIEDDYGHSVDIAPRDIVSTVLTDPEEDWKFRNELSIIKLRAENDFNDRLSRDPTLKFLVGGARAEFGSR